MEEERAFTQKRQKHTSGEIMDELAFIDELLHRILERRVEAAGPFDVLEYLDRNKS